MNGTVYAKVDKSTMQIVYVGKTKDNDRRQGEHNGSEFPDHSFLTIILKSNIQTEAELSSWEDFFTLVFDTNNPAIGLNCPDGRRIITPYAIGQRVEYLWQIQHDRLPSRWKSAKGDLPDEQRKRTGTVTRILKKYVYIRPDDPVELAYDTYKTGEDKDQSQVLHKDVLGVVKEEEGK